MVKDHSDSERQNPLGYSFQLAARVHLYASFHNSIAHTTAFVTPVVEYWLEREIASCFGRKEGNVLFNDTLNTFYLRLYDVTHMVKDHSDSER